MIDLVLPFPPSGNHYKQRSKYGHWWLTDEAEMFKAEVARRTAGLTPFPKLVRVELDFYRGLDTSGRLQRGDGDNLEKVLFDSLQRRAYVTDARIRRCAWEIFEDREHPRVEVRVDAYEPRTRTHTRIDAPARPQRRSRSRTEP